MFKLADGRDCLYQWDSNLKLIVEDESISEVHFMARYSSEIYTVEVIRTESEAYVNIPNILLQQTYSVIAYAFCRDGSDYTKTESAFEVIARPKPSDYVYTETEIKTYFSLEARIKELEEKGVSGDIVEKAIKEYFEKNPIDVDLTEYVKNDDYATSEKGGVVKVYHGNGVSCNNGQLAVVCATEQNIDERKQMSKPITPSNLDYAVISALTVPKVAWSEDAKTLARQTLGIIDGDEVAY